VRARRGCCTSGSPTITQLWHVDDWNAKDVVSESTALAFVRRTAARYAGFFFHQRGASLRTTHDTPIGALLAVGRDDFLGFGRNADDDADANAWIDSTRVLQSPLKLLGEDVIAVHEFVYLVHATRPFHSGSLARTAPPYYFLPVSQVDFEERESRWNSAMVDSLLGTRLAFVWGRISVAWRAAESKHSGWLIVNPQTLQHLHVTKRKDVKNILPRQRGDVLITTRLTPRTRKLRCYETQLIIWLLLLRHDHNAVHYVGVASRMLLRLRGEDMQPHERAWLRLAMLSPSHGAKAATQKKKNTPRYQHTAQCSMSL
jgi:hypothetical protein